MDLDKFYGRLALELQKEIIMRTPTHTGRLRNSINVYKENGEWIVGSNLKYAEYVELGTGLFGPKHHLIFPKKAKALHWIDDEKKHHFAKYVRGMKPRFMFHTAVNRIPQLAMKVVRDLSMKS